MGFKLIIYAKVGNRFGFGNDFDQILEINDVLNHDVLKHDDWRHDFLMHDFLMHDALNHDVLNHDVLNHDYFVGRAA